MKPYSVLVRMLKGMVAALCLVGAAKAASPVWTFMPLTATSVSVPANGTATVQYRVTNQSNKVHTLSMQSISGIGQVTTGLGICGNPFILVGKASCILSLQIYGNQLTRPILDGPTVCQAESTLQCYRPSLGDVLNITPATPIANALITVTGSPLTLSTNGAAGTLTITNTSLNVSTTNISSNFVGTALDGNVTEAGNTCANVAPQASCTLTYTPGSTVVAQTNFTIQGSNTNVASAAIQIDPSSTLTNINPSSGPATGGTGVILTGTNLTGATNVTLGGSFATSVNVVNSTTVTAVTPSHPVGIVDVVITTPTGVATLSDGFTYLPTTVGQSTYGGIIACLNGGLNNLIASTADVSIGQSWGGTGLLTGASSTTDGFANTLAIITASGQSFPNAASICTNYQIDSQGNTPCESGNTCYADWFLPAGSNSGASGQLNCLFTNRVAVGGFSSTDYWSSTEDSGDDAWTQNFLSGAESITVKTQALPVRCVRDFTP